MYVYKYSCDYVCLCLWIRTFLRQTTFTHVSINISFFNIILSQSTSRNDLWLFLQEYYSNSCTLNIKGMEHLSQYLIPLSLQADG